MNSKCKKTRIDIFNELTAPQGTFDYERCDMLLGDNYEKFVNFCDQVRLIPEEIATLDILEVIPDQDKIIFTVSLVDGEEFQFET